MPWFIHKQLIDSVKIIDKTPIPHHHTIMTVAIIQYSTVSTQYVGIMEADFIISKCHFQNDVILLL